MNASDIAPHVSRGLRRRRLPAVALTALVVAIGGAYALWASLEQPPVGSPPAASLSNVSPVGASAAPVPGPTAADLPTSDADLTALIASAFGLSHWPTFAYPDNILRRVVATIDALPRAELPTTIRVIRPVHGDFEVTGADDAPHADPANAARYEPLISALEQISPSAAGDLYARLYPRLQQQYVSLGYPDRSFHKRLLEALDDILAAPAVPEDAALARPNVLFLYADPSLERLSAGQKALMRLGPQGEARAKAQIERIREEVARRPPLSQLK